jgi:hypothetical protein
MNLGRLLIGGYLLFCTVGANCIADILPAQWRSPLPQGYDLNAVTYGNGLFVAVGAYGAVVTSPDGTNWTAQSSGSEAQFLTVCTGGGGFVAGGANGAIYSSVDGTNWVARSSSDTNSIVNSAYGSGVFVLIDNVGGVEHSSDGSAWTTGSTGLQVSSGLAFGNGLFYAIGGGGGVKSVDGVVWTSAAIPPPDSNQYLETYAAAFGNGRFYTVGFGLYDNYPGQWIFGATSTDCSNWVYGTSALFPQPYLAAGDGVTVNAGSGIFLGDASGSNWVQTSTAVVSAAVRGTNAWVAVGAGDEILVSPDATSWTSVTEQPLTQGAYTTAAPFGLVTDGITTIAASGGLTSARVGFYVATNGTEAFNTYVATQSAPYDLAAHGGRLVAVGEGGMALVSSDGLNWSPRTSGTASDLFRVRYVGGKFVAVGSSGALVTSPTGDAWTERFSGTSLGLAGVAENGGLTVAVGVDGVIVTSTDWATWTAQYSTVFNNLNGVEAGAGVFVAVGDAGTILESADGTNWTAEASGVTDALYSVIFDNGEFIASGESGTVLTSSDGVTWAQHTIATPVSLYAVTADSDGYLILGDYQSPNSYFIFHIDSLVPKGLSQPEFRGPGFGFTFSGKVGTAYTVVSSPDLVNWTALYSFTNSGATTHLTDATAPMDGKRFYRVVPQ